MPTDPNASDVTRRRFLAAAGSAVASSVVLANAGESAEALQTPPATNPNTYTITVTVDPKSNSLQYAVSDGNGNPVFPTDPLTVNVQDSVIWKIKSKGSKHNAVIHFAQGTPLVQNYFNWSDLDDGSGATGANPHGGQIQMVPYAGYKYSIAVYDHTLNQIYLNDPTIIVGGGLIKTREEILEATKELEAVRSRIQSIENTLSKAVDQSDKK